MSPAQPQGIKWPSDGRLAPELMDHGDRPFSIYVHVPFCRVRCGYCDFNTYTAGFGEGASLGSYASTVLAEADLARVVVGERQASTVFFGGGTPTLLAACELGRILTGLSERFGIAPGAEITTEANPETVSAESLRALADAGFTRVSVGMQSAVPHVLTTLDRTHNPQRVAPVVQWAKGAGLDVSLDLIYGTPGESLADWEHSLRTAIQMAPDHISAYSLIVEEGTKLAAQISRGEVAAVDQDAAADKYEAADQLLTEAGYRWYEISNFARQQPGEEDLRADKLRFASRHNLAYWKDWDWWGFGPGAHSHVGRARWWNVKHPRAYADRLTEGLSPALKGEVLDQDTRALECLMLGIRTAKGLPADEYAEVVPRLVGQGLVEPEHAAKGRLVLTLRGRLLADYVTRVLAGWE